MDSILADEPSVHTLPDAPESDSPAAPSEPLKAEQPAAPPKDAKAAATADDDESDEGPVPADLDGFKRALSAARGDKRKARKQWQEAERKLAQVEGQLMAMSRERQPATAPTEPKAPDLESEFYSNPVAFVQKQLATTDVDAKLTKFRVDVSEHYARKAHVDYDEKVGAFMEAAKSQPHLWQQMQGAASPAEFAYDYGSAFLEAQEFGGDLKAYKDKLRADILAEIQAGNAAVGESQHAAPGVAQRQPPVRPPIPKSNASARGSGATSTPAWSGPRSLDEILRH